MQVRHIEQNQLVLDKVEKLDPELLPAVHDDKPWEEIVGYLALLAAVHMQPCQTAMERDEKEEKQAPPKDEPRAE
jgi:hypothetical protein